MVYPSLLAQQWATLVSYSGCWVSTRLGFIVCTTRGTIVVVAGHIIFLSFAKNLRMIEDI